MNDDVDRYSSSLTGAIGREKDGDFISFRYRSSWGVDNLHAQSPLTANRDGDGIALESWYDYDHDNYQELFETRTMDLYMP